MQRATPVEDGACMAGEEGAGNAGVMLTAMHPKQRANSEHPDEVCAAESLRPAWADVRVLGRHQSTATNPVKNGIRCKLYSTCMRWRHLLQSLGSGLVPTMSEEVRTVAFVSSLGWVRGGGFVEGVRDADARRAN